MVTEPHTLLTGPPPSSSSPVSVALCSLTSQEPCEEGAELSSLQVQPDTQVGVAHPWTPSAHRGDSLHPCLSSLHRIRGACGGAPSQALCWALLWAAHSQGGV